MTGKQNKKNIPCPECDNLLNLPNDAVIGKVIECPACGIECEIITLKPTILAPLEEEK